MTTVSQLIMSSPLVSVIIPCFNAEKYLAEAIDSALNQTYPNVEVIIVDDASTDGSWAVAKRYESRVKLIQNEQNMERSWSRNLGIAESRGEYIALLDADDIRMPDSIEQQITFLEQHPDVSMVYGKAQLIDEQGILNQNAYIGVKGQPLPIGNDNIAAAGESGLIISPVIPCMTVMFRKKAFNRCGGFDCTDWMQGVEDYDLWLRMSEKNKIAFVCHTLALYRQHSLQTTADPVREMRAYIRVKKHHLRRNPGLLNKYGKSVIWKSVPSDIERRLAKCLWVSKQYDKAAQLALLWAKIAPWDWKPYVYLTNATIKRIIRLLLLRAKLNPDSCKNEIE